ncbi:hypothetical protein RJ55_01330 [Drechmeria coniospora]|nr:hypothetical protein RJ55_01330 [Drechmeria coniospora]
MAGLAETDAGTGLPRVTIHGPDETAAESDDRPVRTWASPLRHHKRSPSAHREVKETLDARVEFTSDETDGRTYHRINQYRIIEEIGRGSYGAVHLAVDHFGNEFAVKEFSKTRLRKRAQSHLLRQGPNGSPRPFGARAGPGGGFGGPLAPQLSRLHASEQRDALFLIREETAIMKKLHHPNLVQLIEVLDDPEEDSLYIVLEMCKKGVVMKLAAVHAQGVIHRDIKPDNLLLSDDDVLKVVDFGVSEMFEKPEEMRTAKSAGSPAFLPPELCGRHQEVSGTAADIWSMGVSLYCLKYGRIPFNRPGILGIYEAIKSDEARVPDDEDASFKDLLGRILDKDPARRIAMKALRDHDWVTKGGSDPLLSTEENCACPVEPPNELELSRAFTRKMNHLLCVMKAFRRFKLLLANIRSRTALAEGDSQPRSRSVEQRAKTDVIEAFVGRRRHLRRLEREAGDDDDDGDAAVQEPLFLGIGTGGRDDFAMDSATPDVVSDSPSAVDYNVYDRAYADAVSRQLGASKSSKPTLYMTKFVEETERFERVEGMVGGTVEETERFGRIEGPMVGSTVEATPRSLDAGFEESTRPTAWQAPQTTATAAGELSRLVAQMAMPGTEPPEARPQAE